MKKNKFIINNVEYSSLQEFASEGRGCATPRPNNYQITRNDNRLRQSRIDFSQIQSIEINVQFIHIRSNENGIISEEMRQAQIDVLNQTYNLANIHFKYASSTIKEIENSQWFKMDLGSSAEHQAKTNLHASPERNLNFYTAGLAPRLLGWATFPWDLEGDRDRDGVVIQCNTLPGGTASPYNLGMTAVHEIGHWLGLYHTFQGGCDAIGDHIEDTVAHKGPNAGKPIPGDMQNNACIPGTQAPIFNYMNYVDDDTMNEFTQMQIDRMKMHVAEYRPGFIV